MINGMLEASRGCLKEEIRMDVISNNLANSTGIGFKKDRVSFQQLLNQETTAPQQVTEEGINRDPYLISIDTDMNEGDIQTTGNELDLAITGDGFFKINTQDGIRYTRKGNFMLNSEGNLVTQDGDPVMGKAGGTINIPISEATTGSNVVVIDDQGTISFDEKIIDQLDMVNFDNNKDLVKVEKGLFRNDSDNPETAVSADTTVKQGYIELSNVNVAEEMVNMIHSMRAFESYQKAIKAIDELNDKAINQVGRLR
jgi:flagellar basal-body rod protein FlgF